MNNMDIRHLKAIFRKGFVIYHINEDDQLVYTTWGDHNLDDRLYDILQVFKDKGAIDEKSSVG